MPIALPQLSLDDIEELDTPIALFASGGLTDPLQISSTAIVISIIFNG
ncbi:MAG: hypothetical protein ABW184_01310 [Sphingobium sp.]